MRARQIVFVIDGDVGGFLVGAPSGEMVKCGTYYLVMSEWPVPTYLFWRTSTFTLFPDIGLEGMK